MQRRIGSGELLRVWTRLGPLQMHVPMPFVNPSRMLLQLCLRLHQQLQVHPGGEQRGRPEEAAEPEGDQHEQQNHGGQALRPAPKLADPGPDRLPGLVHLFGGARGQPLEPRAKAEKAAETFGRGFGADRRKLGPGQRARAHSDLQRRRQLVQ